MAQLQTKWIGDDQVTQAKIASGAVDTTELATDAVDGTKIADDAVDTEHIADDAVEAAQIATGAVTNDGLNASAITAQTSESSVAGDDEVLLYDTSATALRRMTVTNLGLGAGSITMHQEAHVITAGEVSAGYFTISNTPVNAAHVTLFAVGGLQQVNKQAVGASGITPDFDVLSSNQIHINNSGAATGLSEILVADDEVMIQYGY